MPRARVLFLRSNPVDPDPRVEKEALALKEAGYLVRVLGWDRTAALPSSEERPFGVVERLPLPARFGTGLRNLPHLLRFQLRLLGYLLARRQGYDILHACDFDTVLPALFMRLWGKRVVYDIFDFYAEMLRNVPKWVQRVIRLVDLKAIGLADAVILADEARVEQIRGSRPKRLEFIYNAPSVHNPYPDPPDPPPLRIAYVGLLQKERGLLEVIRVLGRHPEWELHLAGFGGDEAEILAAAEGLPNLRFYGRVPYEKALELSAQAHVLFATYDPRIPNHRYSSPNKLFEAMALGKPIVVAEGTSVDRMVSRYGLGFVVRYGQEGELEAAFLEVASWSTEKRRAFSLRSRELFQRAFAWPIMARRLVRLYEELLR